MKQLVKKYKQYTDAGWGIKQLEEKMTQDGLTQIQQQYIIVSLFGKKGKK